MSSPTTRVTRLRYPCYSSPGPDGFVDFFHEAFSFRDGPRDWRSPVLLLALMPGRMCADQLAFEENLTVSPRSLTSTSLRL